MTFVIIIIYREPP